MAFLMPRVAAAVWVAIAAGAIAAGGAAGCDSPGSPPRRAGRDAAPGPRQAARPVRPREGHIVSDAAIARALREGNPEQWFGLYVQGKKVGFASLALRPAGAPGSGGRLMWRVSGMLRATAAEGSSEASFQEDRFYAAEPPYPLVEIRSREDSGAGVVDRVYRNRPDAMIAVQTVDGAAHPERRLPPSREDLIGMLDQAGVEPSEVGEGQSAVVFEFDSAAERDKKTTVKVIGVRREKLSGVDAQVAVLSSQSEGEQVVTESRIASGGITLRAALGDGLEVRWEEKQRAQSQVVGFDMIADAVRIDRPLGDAAGLRELRLVVGAPRNFTLRDAPNQEVRRRADGKLDVVLRARPGPPVLAADRAAALVVSANADADHPAVAALARELTGGVADREEQVGRLVDWVFLNLAKNLSSNLTTASQVLARRAGDCTEHALLFVALARAAGIPAREVSGLVYMGDDIRRFGWHAWAEVDVGGRWLQVDPSWGERVANPTHLTLGVGDDSDWVAAIGSISLALAPAGERARAGRERGAPL
jgi:transglutaminase-like putative cysteine protease